MALERFTEAATGLMASAIEAAGGSEVFAIGELDESGRVAELEIHARGNRRAVPALVGRARPGQVLVHNHPSGTLDPSDADLEIAALVGQEGVGMVIVDNHLERERWVVEPLETKEVLLDPAEVERFFRHDMLRAISTWESRPCQVEMAQEVARVLGEGGALVAEAGTGTGKSLAYLAPAVTWATANRSQVVVSTFTRNLQDQLVSLDIPMLEAAGLEFTWAVMKGRNNYLCRRRLEAATAGGHRGDDDATLALLADWARTSTTGTRDELQAMIRQETWEEVEADAHACGGISCALFDGCFYFNARRKAAAANLLVLNHSLLLADLAIKAESGGRGMLPTYERVVLDEAHHLEQAATSSGAARLSRLAIRRAIAPLLPRSDRRQGLLAAIRAWHGGVPEVARRLEPAIHLLMELDMEAPVILESLAAFVDPETSITDLEEPFRGDADWLPPVEHLAARLQECVTATRTLEKSLEDVEDGGTRLVDAVLELRRARLRLTRHADQARSMLHADENACRWMETRSRDRSAVLCRAPINVGPFLDQVLHKQMRSIIFTSATLSIRSSFDYFMERAGLAIPDSPADVQTRTWPSPFCYPDQAVLGLPRDLPVPDRPGHTAQVGQLLVRLLSMSGGGAFVLCTSFRQLNELADLVEAAPGLHMPVLRQEAGNRTIILEQFRQRRDSVLFGTDSFWEGVSVRGDGLRLVVIPRIPFGVPTEPVAKARHKHMASLGRDPFRALSLPEAVLRLRQGFGRLIRSQADRGAVVILDRRLHEKWYGRIFISSLPDAARVVGPSRLVLQRIAHFYRDLDTV